MPLPKVWDLIDRFGDHCGVKGLDSRKVALYDLNQAYRGELTCLKLNETGSLVFQEFERFLNAEYGIKLTPLTTSRRLSNNLKA